jgi:hypothetical protein
MVRTDGEYRDGPLADKETVRKKGLDERLARRTELADVHALLSQRAGRRFVWRLLSECGVFKSSFTGNNSTFFNEGRRDIGLRFMVDVQEFPDLYLLMVKESREPLEKEKEDGPRMMEAVTRDVEGAD